MPLNYPPLGYTGQNVENSAQPQITPGICRAATLAEANAGTRTDVFISPSTESASVQLDFANPPVAGYGSMTARPVAATTISGNSETLTGVAGATVGLAVTTAAGTGIGITAISSAVTIPDIKASLGGIQVPAPTVAGATPIVNNTRSGQVSFTNTIATVTVGSLVMTNSLITSASVIIATASCTTASTAVGIVFITPGSGTVTFGVYNAGGSTTAANININFWILN